VEFKAFRSRRGRHKRKIIIRHRGSLHVLGATLTEHAGVRRRERSKIPRLLGSLLEVGDEVIPVLGLLQASERHLGTRDVLFRVLEILEECFLSPSHAFINISSSVREIFDLARLAAEQPVEVRSDLVGFASGEGVTLRTASFEETRPLGCVALLEAHFYDLG